ncbi:MAG: RsmG family class I SAM-dependent methyltransferase [Acidimicrobiales bacterium]
MDRLAEVLAGAQQRGLIGPAPVAEHRAHASGFFRGLGEVPDVVVDLGAGGGVPGLVLAWEHPGLHVELVDGRRRATDWLEQAVHTLDLEARVNVQQIRAEELGREEQWRGRCTTVVARGFGPPAVLAECAAPLLGDGGQVVVSDPPTAGDERWPDDGLAMLGLVSAATWSTDGGHYRVLRATAPCGERFPRRVGIPAKRPLW